MTSPLSAAATDRPDVVNVRVIGLGGQDLTRQLPSGDALVIGCSPACGLRLEGPGIAGLHCTISFDENGLTVEDWDTEIGTYVNGERVPSRMVIGGAAEVKIGDYQLLIEAARKDPLLPDEKEPVAQEIRPSPVDSSLKDLLRSEVAPAGEVPQPADDVPLSSDRFDDGGNGWDSPFDDISETHETAQTGYVRDGLGDDPAELLQVEVEFLRTELAERDARLAELQEFAASDEYAPGDDLPSRDEVETLLGRLEQLLEELEQSDERVSTMSELLRMSDEANVAALEERSQMESWIGEVERRVRQWEEEWHAEREVMEKSIADLTAQRDRAESQGGAPEQSELINELREHARALQSQLQQTQAERDGLNHRLETAQVSSVEEQVAAAVEAAMREERLQMSQTKAQYARERADLAKEREEMTFQQSSASEPDIADIRIRAFREHLKEVRATEPNGRPAPTLSDRLGKLWRKIDGKPLDTD